MNRKAQLGKWLLCGATLVGVVGVQAGVPEPVRGQSSVERGTQSAQIKDELRQLSEQVEQLYKQGEYGKAIPLAERALALKKKIYGEEHPRVALSLNNLALLYFKQGNYAKAEPLLKRSLTIFKKALGKQHPKVATNLNNLGLLYSEQGNYAKAEPLYQRSLKITKKVYGEQHPKVATALSNLANLYYYQGNYAKAESLYQRSLTIWKKALGKQHPKVATNLNNLGRLYSEQGNYAKAEPLFQRSLTILKKAFGEQHPKVATSLNNLASLYHDQGNYAKAEPLFQRSLTIWKKALGKQHPSVAISLNNLAGLYHYQGNYAKAEPLLKRSLKITKKVYGEQHPSVAVSLNNLAVLYFKQGNYAKAEPLLKRSLKITKKVYGKQNFNLASRLNNLAVLSLAQGNIPRAIEFLSRSTNIQEKNLALNLTIGSSAQKRAYMATFSNTTNLAVSLHLQQAPENLEAARLALTTVLRRKGRVLDAVANTLPALRKSLDPQQRNLLDQLAAKRSQLASLLYEGSEDTSPEAYRNQIGTLKAQAQQLEAKLSRRSDAFHRQTQTATIPLVQQLLPQDAALVELVRYRPFNAKATNPDERRGAPRYAAYVLSHSGEPQWVDLGEAEAINSAVTTFRQALQDPTSDVRQAGRELDALVMQPIRSLLGKERRLLVSPDGQLSLVPFAALVDQNNNYLIKNYSISYLSSGRDLLAMQDDASSSSEPLILANPNYANPGNPTAVEEPETSRSTSTRSRDLAQINDLNPLPGTKAEAKAIASLLPEEQMLMGSQATENALKQAQRPSILHIASHGFFLKGVPQVAPLNWSATRGLSSFRDTPGLSSTASAPTPQENPLLRSGLALAGFNPRSSGTEDGVVTALEVTGLNLHGTQLVVLSACETGVGTVTNGEGVYGLRRAFAIAGAESQLISLWNVSDKKTKDLMVQYYQKLVNGKGRSEALRQSQLAMLSNSSYQHPYYWAAFIPSGNWRAMETMTGDAN